VDTATAGAPQDLAGAREVAGTPAVV